MKKEEFEEKTFPDYQGYLRWKKNKKLIHRGIAYKYIYLKNRKEYPLSFSEYQVHHKDKDKKNNRVENLKLIPIREHELKHKIIRHEYSIIHTYMVFAFIALLWFGYLGFVSGYKYNFIDVLFMLSITIFGAILIYIINRKKKGFRYK